MEEDRGFAAIVSNPPFQGGSKITGPLGTDYRDYLVGHLAQGKRGRADLCAYFFLRASSLVCLGGMCGLLATNTIAQGETREVGLEQIEATGWTVLRAVSTRRWPGTASLEVAHIWLRRGYWHGPYLLDEKLVEGITPFLSPLGVEQGKLYALITNANKSFEGSKVGGRGFVLDPEDAQVLLARHPRNRDVLFPYLNGEDLNTRYDQSPSRWVINFHDWPLGQAETYIDCISIVQEKVKPERIKNNRQAYRERWWQYGERRPGLYSAIAGMKRVLVCPKVTKYLSFHFVATGQVFMDKLYVFPFDKDQYLALLNSSFHDNWARKYSGTLGNTLQYAPTDCFETFPFPNNMEVLDVIGKCYNQHRQSIMLSRQEGLTKTYNRYHDPQEMAEDIVQFRTLHKEMDEEVAKAYGWGDLILGHSFHETKQGLRYTISEEARREVLGRLLRLNHERYAEEVTLGLHEKGAKKGKGKRSIGKRNEMGKGQDGVGEQGELVFE